MLYLIRQVYILALIIDFFPINKADAVTTTSLDNLLRTDGIIIVGSEGKDLRHIDDIILILPRVIPFHIITLLLMICRELHQRNVRESPSSIYIYESYPAHCQNTVLLVRSY